MKKKLEDYLIDVKKKGYRCLKCDYEWIPRKKNGKPQTCPKCKKRGWDKPKKIRLLKINKY